MACSIGVERQHAIAEQLEQTIECASQAVPPPARRQHTDPEQHLGKGDAGEVERFGDLLVQPGPHGGIWRRLHRLGDHIGVEYDQEQDKKLDSTLDWLQLKRDEIRQVLGFFIGEPPVDPFADSTAPLATGPP